MPLPATLTWMMGMLLGLAALVFLLPVLLIAIALLRARFQRFSREHVSFDVLPL